MDLGYLAHVHVMFRIKTAYMIPQTFLITLSTDILVKFAHRRKQTSHGVVREKRFSVVRATMKL